MSSTLWRLSHISYAPLSRSKEQGLPCVNVNLFNPAIPTTDVMVVDRPALYWSASSVGHSPREHTRLHTRQHLVIVYGGDGVYVHFGVSEVCVCVITLGSVMAQNHSSHIHNLGDCKLLPTEC